MVDTVASNLCQIKRLGKFSLLIVLFFAFGFSFFGPDVRAGSLNSISDAIKKDRWGYIKKLGDQEKDPILAKLLHWTYFSHVKGKVDFNAIEAFIDNNPQWPRQMTLQLRAEFSMSENMDHSRIIRFFKNRDPVSARGMDMYLMALKRVNREAKAKDVLRDFWHVAALTPSEQRHFLSRYSYLLTKDDHKKRYNFLLYNRYYTNARALASKIGKGYGALAEARIALAEMKNGVDTAIARVPQHLQDDEGLNYERLRWRRRKDLDDRALHMLRYAPDFDEMGNPKLWWQERHILARRFLEKKQYQKAYDLVSTHKQKSGFAKAQAEWLSGWIALRFNNEPWKAFKHFEGLYKFVHMPVSRARAAYWAGRASEALEYPDIAEKWYRVAARYQSVFYGQLAARKLNGEAMVVGYEVPPAVSDRVRRAFYADETVKVVQILKNLGQHDLAGTFLRQLVDRAKTPEDYVLVAELAQKTDYLYHAVQSAKKAYYDGIDMVETAYPKLDIVTRSNIAEPALALAVIRQESAFDVRAKSVAGARGLMQLMPATAKGVAKKYGLRHHTAWLTTRPAHNVDLGMRYLQQMLDRFDGSYVLAVAAYNAGPSRVSRWIREYGDPRSSTADIIDWIETMPVYETRNYVQRVLEGLYVYRNLLQGDGRAAQRPDPFEIALRN